ncbi:Transcription elongation regulator 1 [Amphibalanus amphitrite]|uniref:Transcription elongation regulator 1 n=1 Tax=Amphibalanus amphitrite TaxID=1232801 RepID=A0A6A4WKG7_AMPAM|nr:Transcription elongation regulator 1 [Amphibalanus amphitrite]
MRFFDPSKYTGRWPDPPGDPPGPPWRGPPPPRFRGRGGPPGPPWNGPPGPRGPWRGPPPPPFFRGPRPPFRGPPPFDPNWDPHPGMMGPGGPMEPHPPGPPGMGGPGMGPPPGHWSDPMSPPSGPPPFSGPRPSHHSAPPPQIADLEAARLAAAAVAAGEINPTELLEVESEPLEVESEPLEVKSEPLEVKSEPLEVNSEPLEVTPEPVEVKSEPLEVEEVEEPAPAKQEDESRPVSSTPVPGSPWCVVWTGDGRVFFYNPSTRTSVWERPEELNGRTDVDKMLQPPKQEPAESKDDEPPAKKVKVEETKKEVKEEAPEEIDLGKEAAIEARSEIPMKQSRDKLNEKEVGVGVNDNYSAHFMGKRLVSRVGRGWHRLLFVSGFSWFNPRGPIGFLHTRRPRGGGGGYDPPRRFVPGGASTSRKKRACAPLRDAEIGTRFMVLGQPVTSEVRSSAPRYCSVFGE